MFLPHHHIMVPLPFTPSTTMVIWVPVSRKCRVCATPQPFPLLYTLTRPSPPPSSTSFAFFVTLQFSDLVPYVAILNTFHVKRYVNFWRKTPTFPKKLSNVLTIQFFTGFSENIVFPKKNGRIKYIQHVISDRKGYIRFWCKVTPYRSHSDPAAPLQPLLLPMY